jgi:hypothetical protein
MSVKHSIIFTSPITYPERFAAWSRDVQKLLDYLPRYVAVGRKQRIFAMPLDSTPARFSAGRFYEYYEQHHLEPLILPDQQEVCEQFIQQLPINPDMSFPLAHDYKQSLSDLYGEGPHVIMLLGIAGKGNYVLMGIEQGGTNPIPIRGADGTGEPVVTETEVAFNIDSNTYDHGDVFQIRLKDLLGENEASSSGYLSWKVPVAPYDVVVQAALILLTYHIPEISIYSDRAPYDWWEALLLCQKLFSIAELPPSLIDFWGDLYKGKEAKSRLIHLANSLPDSIV